MFRLRTGSGVAVLLALALLVGCDNNDQQTPPTAAAEKSTATQQTELTAAQKVAEAERDKGKPLTVVDISEVQLDGASTLVATFSVALDDKQDFAQKLHLVDSKSGALDGG